MTGANRGEIALSAAYIASTGGSEYAGRPRPVDKPLNVMVQENRQVLAAAHITKFRKNSVGSSVADPAPVMTANSFEQRPGCAAPVGLVASYMVQTGYGEREGQAPRALDIEKPIGVQVAGGGKHAVVAAHMIQNNGGEVGHSVGKPVSTLPTKVGPQALAVSHLAHLRGSGDRPGNSVEDPTVSQTSGGTHVAEVRTFLVKYYQSAEHGQASTDPLHSITTKARFGLVEVSTADIPLTEEQRYNAYWVARLIDVYGHPLGKPPKRSRKRGVGSLRWRGLQEVLDEQHRQRPSAVGRDGWLVWDIGMRMLTVRERFRAQGVGDDFIIDVDLDGKPITATKQGEMCGNMVCPGVAEAIVRVALPELRPSEEAAAA